MFILPVYTENHISAAHQLDYFTRSQLTEAARYFAEFMARTDKFGHTADGQQPWHRATKYGYDYCIVLENIAVRYNSGGFGTTELAQGFVTSWKDSPGHRKNLLDPDVREIGSAVAESRSMPNRYYAVQLFGRPKSDSITFKISNRTSMTIEYTLDDRSFTLEPRYTRTHEVCKTPRLTFTKGKIATTAAATEKPTMLLPKNGAHYVLRAEAAGQITIQKE